MRRSSLICAVVALLGFVFALPGVAFAQDGASVVILKFERMDASDEIVRVLEASLAEGIETHDDMHVKKGGEVTIQDLALTAGCDASEVDCMKSLRDFVDADRIVFGSVQASDDVYLFSMKMFDFAEGRYVAEMTDQTVEGEPSEVKKVIPALVDNFIYGDVGVLVVEVTGADSPDLIFDGEKVGLAPTRLENLPLGEHVVTVKTADGKEKTRTVVLRADEPETIAFAFESDVTTGAGSGPEEPTSGDGPSAVPGWVSIGIGAIALGVGGFSSYQVVQANDANAALADDGFVDPDTGALVGGDSLEEGREEATSIDQRGKTYQTLQYVGYGVGGVGVVLGTVLLIRAMGGGDTDTAESAGLDFGVAPSRDGVAATLRLRF